MLSGGEIPAYGWFQQSHTEGQSSNVDYLPKSNFCTLKEGFLKVAFEFLEGFVMTDHVSEDSTEMGNGCRLCRRNGVVKVASVICAGDVRSRRIVDAKWTP